MPAVQIDRKSFGSWFGGIFLLVGVLLFAAGIFRFYDDWRFAQEARPTQGTVLRKERTESSSTGTDGIRSRTTTYEVTYRFTVEGAILEGRDELPYAAWDRLKEGEPADVPVPAGAAFVEPPRRSQALVVEYVVCVDRVGLRLDWRRGFRPRRSQRQARGTAAAGRCPHARNSNQSAYAESENQRCPAVPSGCRVP